MSSLVAFRPRRIYAFEFANHRSLPLAALRVRMTSHECNEFAGTREKQPQTLSFRAGARNLLLTKSWRTADSSSLGLLGMTRCKVSRPASTTPKPCHFERSEKSAFDQKLENSRFLVAWAPRNDKE